MKRIKSCLLITYCILMALFSFAQKVNAKDSLERQFRVLFISSYGFSNAAVPEQLKGFEAGIDGINVDICYEFMDADKYYGGMDIQNFDKYLKYKIYSVRSYDLIVASDDSALRYVINNRIELFPDTPLVFMGVSNKTEAMTAAAMKNATGITEIPDFEGNYALMKKLFPGRDHLNVVVDATIAGQGDYVEYMKFKDENPDIKSTVINTSYYTANGLKELLGSLGDDDIILFLDFARDGDGNSYSLANASDFMSTYAPDVPIMRLASSDIEHGVLGGISYSFYDAGWIAGDAAKRIILGENADDMPLMTSTVTTPYFEQGSMDHFGIKYSMLPDGSQVLNEHKNLAKFYRENTMLSNLVIVIVLLMIAIIFILNITNAKRKRLMRTDFLTQMPNRMKLIEDMNQTIGLQMPYGLIMLDVDHFKDINDTYGHKVGDEIIAGVGERLKKLSKNQLQFARLGGDEFSGLFTSPSNEKAKKICESIIKSTKAPFKTSAGELKLTVSIGCAMYPLDVEDPNKVMESADSALYVTKENGRNGYTLFDSIDKT